MIKKNKTQLIISSVIILLPVVIGLVIWNFLPEQIATHWGMNNKPDGWSGRYMAIFGLPVMMLALHWLCIFFVTRDSKNKEQNGKVFSMVLWIIPIISLVVCGSTYVTALGKDVNMAMIMQIILGVLFVVMGNYMPKCKQNSTIGVRVTWTLHNEENWNKTHRFAGRLWFFCGMLLLLTIFLPTEKYAAIYFILILLMALAPMIYSYVYYRKQLKEGTVTKEDMAVTPSEKKMNRIVMAVVIFVLVFAAIFVFDGKYEVKYDENSFTIEAAYWEDVTVDYKDITDIEYSKEDNPGNRTFGYGTPQISMGEFENSEFGKYTRYTYASCKECIVLTVDGEKLVINGKDEKQTKGIYDELSRRMNE